jgi:hypothetical protein
MDQPQEEMFRGITGLSVEGGGIISIDSTGLIDVEPKTIKPTVLQKGSTLLIKLPNIGGNVVSGMVVSNVVYFGGSSTSVINGNTITFQNGQLYMNGMLMVPAGSEAARGKATEEKKEKEEPKKVYRLSVETKIGAIKIIGSGTIKRIAPEFFSSDLELNISGSGDISLQPNMKFRKLSAVVSGSGDIDCGGSSIDQGRFDVSGSGDISNFHILESANAAVSGSGDIRGTKKRGADIDQSSSGSGKIKISSI